MGRRRLLRAALAAALAGIAGCSGGRAGPQTPATETASPPSTAAHTAASPPPTSVAPTSTDEPPATPGPASDSSTDHFTPVSGPGTPPSDAKPGSLGPWATGIRLAESTDGLTFDPTDLAVSDRAGVPDAVVDDDGRLRVYYVAWADPSFGFDVGPDFLAVAVDDGADGFTFRRLVVQGGPQGGPGYADPTVVRLADGSYRLFYMADVGNFTLRILSATSDDGLRFTQDAGERLAPDGPVFDPMVLPTDAGWWLWAGPEGRYSARSADGLSFERRGPFEVDGERFHPWAAVALPGGGYRLYGDVVGESGLRSAHSADGSAWALDPGDRSFPGLDATDVGVAVRPDGGFVMAYLTTLR